jgi:hypothetical protein
MGRPAESPGGRTGGPTAMTGGPDTELPLVARISRHLVGLGAWGWLSHQDAAPQSSTLLREGDARSSRAVGTGAGSHSRDRLKDRLPQDGTVHATVPTAVAARGLSARRHSALSTSGALLLCANLSGVIPGRPEGPGPESIFTACGYGFRARRFAAPRNDREIGTITWKMR